MPTIDENRASLTRAVRKFEALQLSLSAENAVMAMIGAAVSHLGLIIHALAQKGLGDEALGLLHGMAVFSESGRGSVLPPPSSALWGPALKSFKWGPLIFTSPAASGLVVLCFETEQSQNDPEAQQHLEKDIAALAQIAEKVEVTLVTLIGEESLAAAIGALAQYLGFGLHSMRKQGKANTADQILESLLHQAETGRSSGAPLTH